ncbi:MAG: hypothetical protein KJ737_12410 [Proteobacteria bacterium]|nr:hypothetical protein [Pseudomonadota bacterium]
MGEYKTYRPKRKILKWLYLYVFMWFTGRAIKIAAKVDDEVKKEFDSIPNNFNVALEVLPYGPALVVGKTEDGKVQYLGSSTKDKKIDLRMIVHNIENAMQLFTFQESTAISFMRNRLYLDGEIPYAAAFVRVFDAVEVYLLPKIIAKLAVKRYPAWSLIRKLSGRVKIYLRAGIGV